jgi:hypothetical protein
MNNHEFLNLHHSLSCRRIALRVTDSERSLRSAPMQKMQTNSSVQCRENGNNEESKKKKRVTIKFMFSEYTYYQSAALSRSLAWRCASLSLIDSEKAEIPWV